MKGFNKVILDLVFGAVLPILILNNFARLTGSSDTLAYIFAALVPVAYVLIDTLFISRRLNVITSYVALSTIISGILVFWYVDGIRYAIKDTAALIAGFLVFGGSILIGKPMLQFFAANIFQPDTPQKQRALNTLFADGNVRKNLVIGTAVIALYNVIAGVVNFILNLNIVKAAFGSAEFNAQVAEVNFITRIIFTIGSMAAFAGAIFLLYRALFARLPKEDDKSQFESDFWELVAKAGLLKNEE